MPLRDEFGGEGIEALLARTRRQISIFILGATALVVAVVGVGGALAGNSALDAGLDNALLARADRIVHEIQEALPPLPSTPPDPGGSPSPSASPEESESPGASQSPDDDRSPEASGVPMPSASPGEDDGSDDVSDSGFAPAVINATFRVALGARRDYPQPSIPPGFGGDEFGAGGPWAVLSANGVILAGSAGGTADFPVLTLIQDAQKGPSSRTVLIGRSEFRIITAPIRHTGDPTGPLLGYVQVAGRLDVRDAQRQNLFGSDRKSVV